MAKSSGAREGKKKVYAVDELLENLKLRWMSYPVVVTQLSRLQLLP
jgi:hypothetical protein